MYRTATLAAYDVLDQVFINAVIKEYPSTPGTEPPREIIVSATVPSRGEEDPSIWLWTALQALQHELDDQT